MADSYGSENAKNQGPIRLAQKYANSDKFKSLFGEGMHLVEESAAFLDGPGRDAVKTLDRTASLVYGAESMRLTTRLMQLASWLLLQRAANEGELSYEQILEEKKKVRLDTLPSVASDIDQHNLPKQFIELIDRSLKLQSTIIRLDAELYGQIADEHEAAANPVNEQLELLSTALGTKISN